MACRFIVTVPPGGMVTGTWTVLPTMLTLPLVAPPWRELLGLVTLPNWAGTTSSMLAVVSVEGPALLTTREKLTVPPSPTVVRLDVLLTLRLTVGCTLNAALTATVFEPTEVVSEPAGIVFVIDPETELVTTTETEQLEPWGIRVPEASVRDPSPGVELAVPTQLVCATELAELTRPVGYRSVKSADSVAETSACVLVIVMVNSAVPPTLMLASEKLLAITGLDGETRSRSWAEQTPVPTVQDAEGLVLLTLAGGVMVTTLLTWVCAWAIEAQKKSRNGKATSPTQRRT